MVKIDWIIGIDPDVDKNGVATLDCATKSVNLATRKFPELLEYLAYVKRQSDVEGKAYRVLIEAGWLNKGNWHLNPRDTKAAAAAKGNHAGRNHETGRKIVEMCEYWQIPYELIKPLKKIWKGPDGKITHQELSNFMLIGKKSNQEARDAALITWVWAGFPIKMM